jgi:hypothetical protein
MRAAIRVLTVCMLPLLVTGCDVDSITLGAAGSRLPERFEPWLLTDRETHVILFTPETIEFEVPFTFTNRGPAAVAIPRCTQPGARHGLPMPALDKLVQGEWVEVLRAAESCFGDPLVIRRGASHEFTARIVAGRPHTHIQPQFRTTQLPGSYRLRWEVYEHDPFASFRFGRLLPVEYRVSNEFRLTF